MTDLLQVTFCQYLSSYVQSTQVQYFRKKCCNSSTFFIFIFHAEDTPQKKKEITKRRNNVRNKIAAAKYLFASIPLTDHETFSNGNLITPSKQSFTQTYKRPIVTQQPVWSVFYNCLNMSWELRIAHLSSEDSLQLRLKDTLFTVPAESDLRQTSEAE